MPSPYVKKGYGEISKRAEERLRKEIIIKCKICNSIMKKSSFPKSYLYHCAICLRNVDLLNYK